MQRVTRSTAVAVLPSPPASPGAPGYFSGGDPVAGVPATVPGQEWFNGVQEELIAVIADGGLVPNASTLTQLRDAMRTLYRGGRLINVQVFTASGTYTPTPGMGSVVVEVLGGGGAGGGGIQPFSGNVSLGAPGGAGSFGSGRFTAASVGVSQAVTVGAGGVPGFGASGGNGGTSSFGALLSAPGGVGGLMLNNQVPPSINGNGVPSSAPSGANISSGRGGTGNVAFAVNASTGHGGEGGASRVGGGAAGNAINANGANAASPGSGGSGSATNNGGGGNYSGGAGAAGLVVVWEYS